MLQPIILIDDDEDDRELFTQICKEVGISNQIIAFDNSIKAYNYLVDMLVEPFFILCDFNMPQLNGLELRHKIDSNEKLRLRAMPFLMWSTVNTGELLKKAYSLNVQGFFKKSVALKDLEHTVLSIYNYWSASQKP